MRERVKSKQSIHEGVNEQGMQAAKAIRACRLVVKSQAEQVGSARTRGPEVAGRAAKSGTGPDAGH